MSKWIRLAFAALALLIVFFSMPFWLPGAVASIGGEVQAKPVNPAAGGSPILLSDTGWMTGTTTMRVQSAPQMIAWLPGQAEPAWATETGFSYGGFYDSASGRLFLIEQRSTDSKTLLGLDIPERALYPPNAQWPLFLTELDVETGAVISTVQLDTDFVYSANGGIGRPVALVGDTLYIMKYGSINNLTAFDLNAQEFDQASLELCDTAYPMHVSFVSDLNSFATLCMDYTTGMDSSLALTPLDGEQVVLDVPLLGDEEYMSGNGLVVVGATAYVIDSDARAIVEVELESMTITRTANYAENLSTESSLGEQFVAWLLDQSAGVAHAKRWFAMPALSPDGRTLVIDSGMGLSGGQADSIYIIDLETLQASQELELNGYPTSMTFDQDGLLYVFLEKGSHRVPLKVELIDIATGAQSQFEITMASSAYEVYATR
jgi:hypothetical protein